jgi:hypothetical protein
LRIRNSFLEFGRDPQWPPFLIFETGDFADQIHPKPYRAALPHSPRNDKGAASGARIGGKVFSGQ